MDVLQHKQDGLQKEIQDKFPPEVAKKIADCTAHAQLAQHARTKQRHIEKFSRLRQTYTSRADKDNNWRSRDSTGSGDQESNNWVRNLSSRDLSEYETSVLSKGLNYAVTPKQLPVSELITATESAIRQGHFKPTEADEIRHDVSSLISRAELPKQNITKHEQKALEDLAKDEKVVIVPADKGRCVVVLDKKDYVDKCHKLLEDDKTYKKIGYNPTNGYRKTVHALVNKLHKEGGISDEQKRLLTPPTEPAVPAFYGLPKVHKLEPIPVRPIVSSIDSVTYGLAKHVAKILGPLVGTSLHHVKNTQDFVDKISQIALEDDETIVSYDVSALFTSIPPAEAIQVVKKNLENDSQLKDRTKLSVDQIVESVSVCLNTTYFSFQDQHYIQKHGCAMGSPISPIVANLYMQDFETVALKSYTGSKPRVWLRYVDDTFVIVKKQKTQKFWLRYVDDTFVIVKKQETQKFFQHINTCDPNISFTTEECKDQKLAFLDVEVHISSDG
ncbi:uncharacterized protein [Diadema antillarum]|uniref:uncharacterized protein n=1 Tax=Diadema antillarum TaxID=105358 RepID=UPI003A8AAB4E